MTNYTIGTTLDAGISLQPGGSYASPLTITSTGAVLASTIAIYTGHTLATIDNSGLLVASDTLQTTYGTVVFEGLGVVLESGGTVINTATGTISGVEDGVLLNGTSAPATLENSGLIEATASTIDIGTFHYPSTAVLMPEGGVIINEKGGSIIGQGLAIQHAGTGTATVINDGLIQALGSGKYTDAAGYSYPGALILNTGGLVTNQSSGTIIGEIGVQLGGPSNSTGGYLDNYGSVLSGFVAVAMFDNATVVNSGLIGSEEFGIDISSNDINVTNNSTGLIIGVTVSSFYENSYIGGTVTNFGTLEGGEGGIAMKGSTLDIASIVNDGTIIGTDTTYYYDNDTELGYSAGVDVLGAANVVNDVDGYIQGENGEFFTNNATSENAGTIVGVDIYSVLFDGTDDKMIIDPGAVFEGLIADLNGDGTVEFRSSSTAGVISSSQFEGFSTFEVDGGANWTITNALTLGLSDLFVDLGTMTLAGALANDGTFVTDPAIAVFESAVTGTGTIIVETGSQDFFYGSVASTETINLDGGTIVIADPTEFNAAVIGTGTEETICYLAGTKILSMGGEVPVEELKAGDALPTYFGGIRKIKWIGQQSFASRFIKNNPDCRPVRIEAGALGDGVPARDLYVSGGHSMLIKGQLVLARNLINGVNITNQKAPDVVHYYQIEFDTHDCVMANGAWSESYADAEGMRDLFHNASTFYEQYPDYVAPPDPVLCAPRYLDGPQLDAALWPIVAKAQAKVTEGPMRGWLDTIEHDCVIAGWAQDEKNPELPVLLEIHFEGAPIGTVLACEYRADLAEAGVGNGRQAFRFTSPFNITDDVMDMVVVRRVSDGSVLPRSHRYLEKMGGPLEVKAA